MWLYKLCILRTLSGNLLVLNTWDAFVISTKSADEGENNWLKSPVDFGAKVNKEMKSLKIFFIFEKKEYQEFKKLGIFATDI